MNDLRSALSRAAGAPAPYDVEADVARGRRALRHRRTARGAGALVLVTAAAGGLRLADSPVTRPSVDAAPSPTPGAPSTSAPANLAGVRLVAFGGSQPSGYRVAYLPVGWEIQGADPFAMTIARVGDPDRHPASFTGKLVVMLRSSDATGTPPGDPVRVGARTGYLSRAEETASLTYQDSRGHWVVVQVPPSLGWTDEQIARFGAGVEVTRDAEPGVG